MDGGSINIKVERVEDNIRISVQNTGRIDTSDLKGGLGLKNLEERLMLLYGNRASLKITQSASDTVSSVIIIPAS
jgi:LytS/YehU family sensor histidine kinase